MRTLGLDPATDCGWAVDEDGRTIACGTWHLGEGVKTTFPEAIKHGHRITALVDALEAVIAEHKPDRVVFEMQTGTTNGTYARIRLQGGIVMAAVKAGLPVAGVWVGTWRAAVLGNGGLGGTEAKAAAVALCLSEGIVLPMHKNAPDDDAAEAVCIARWGYLDDAGLLPVAKQKPRSRRRKPAASGGTGGKRTASAVGAGKTRKRRKAA